MYIYDLLANVNALAAGGERPAWACLWGTWNMCTWSCYGSRPCGVSRVCDDSGPVMQVVAGTDPAAAREHLAALKAQLNQVLANIDAHERALAQSLPALTLDQVKERESKLRAELDQLSQRRNALEKK